MNSRPVLLFFVVALLAAPIQIVIPQLVIAQTGLDSQAKIASVLDEWSVDWKARDAGAISELYAQDAIIYPAIDRRVNPQDAVGDFKGPHAIRDYFEQLFVRLADPKIGEFVRHELAEQSADMAFDDGFVQYLVKGKCKPSDPGDGPCVLKGYNLTVLKRGSNGKWLIVRQSFTQIGLGSTIYTPH
jgi:ketosteroid isomerase-like protein